MSAQDNDREWRQHILDLFARLEAKVDKLDEKADKHGEDLAGLKVKAGIWGGIAGFLPMVIEKFVNK